MHYHGWHLACQTYALNLIDSHSGQNRAPQLFSSSKSFRVAKSTPSSGSLLPISKRLSKPPLLFKLALFFAPLLLLSYTQGIQALTAQTSRVIEGSAPYLTFDGGRTKATNTDTFLAIELPDGRRITQSTNTSSVTNPIMLPSGNYTFNDIHTVLPSGATSISLNSLISQGKWGDDDGDGQGVRGVTASGSISLAIKDKDGATVSRGDTLSICKAPYKVTLDSTGGSLTTQYGVPNSSRFYGGTVDYYITLPSQPVICSVRPMLYFGGSGINFAGNVDDSSYAGPSNIWSRDKGFFVQSTSPSSYDLNFPTTGADGLYFDLDIGGLDGSQLIWTVNTGGSLGATVSRVGSNTRVTLSGPRASSTQINSDNPSPLDVPSLPQTFELVGRDSNGNEVRYGFVLKQWFVHRGNQEKYYTRQLAWCNRLGYRLSKLRDLTNSNNYLCTTPSSSCNHYMRYIGAGLFTEWGYMSYYTGAGFAYRHYLASEVLNGSNFTVFSANGYVGSIANTANAVCTTP